MKISQIKKGLILVTIASAVLAVGCELIVDFDRTKIPVEAVEASTPDAQTNPPVDGGTDAQPDQSSTPDADAATVSDADADADQ